jgi:hypothetical protein
VASAYSRLSAAAKSGDSQAYDSALRSVSSSERAVTSDLRRLSKLGYSTG